MQQQKSQDVFLRPSFHGQILDCTALLYFVHHALYNLRICSCQCRRAKMFAVFYFHNQKAVIAFVVFILFY